LAGSSLQLASAELRGTSADSAGLKLPFQIEESRRHCLLHGLDDIALTLQREADITAYERSHGITI
jgi:3-isopropylmalate dehydratase small subunit